MTPIHPAAARGFASAADAYERGRPGYPRQALDRLVRVLAIDPGRTVLDLGAGTGKLTRDLEPTGATIVAVEPVEAMRAVLSRLSPDVRALAGTAEEIPVDDGSVDAVVAAQAFHWFATEGALGEIHRVLRPGGRLALVWNVRDESVDWVARLTEIIHDHRGDTPHYSTGDWRLPFEHTQMFGEIHSWATTHLQEMEPETLIDRVISISFIATMDADARAEVSARVRELIRTHPGLRGQSMIALPYRTDIHWCERRGPTAGSDDVGPG